VAPASLAEAPHPQPCVGATTGAAGALSVIELDVLDEQSALDAVAHIDREAGGLDVVVHNAAHLYVGITEAFDADEVLRAFDVNAVGALLVNRAVLPVLRRQESGLLLWIGSGTTRGVPPFTRSPRPTPPAPPPTSGSHRSWPPWARTPNASWWAVSKPRPTPRSSSSTAAGASAATSSPSTRSILETDGISALDVVVGEVCLPLVSGALAPARSRPGR
jgi:NAD(P)-dependent dehydrogenase (short-subunit alcohol dehydrogenase family)